MKTAFSQLVGRFSCRDNRQGLVQLTFRHLIEVIAMEMRQHDQIQRR
jgi:hypothetical protein